MLMTNKDKQTIILWGLSASPYVRKVMIALVEKNVAYEQREILPKILLQATGQTIPIEFEKASPLGKIPALQVGNFCIADSAVIIAYLEKKFTSGNSLYPSNPENYARALWFEHYADNVLTNVAYKEIFLECVIKPNILQMEPNKKLVEEAKINKLPLLLDYLEQAVKQFSWIAGDEFSVADIAIATQLIALQMAKFELHTNRWPALNIYLAKIIARPSFKNILAK